MELSTIDNTQATDKTFKPKTDFFHSFFRKEKIRKINLSFEPENILAMKLYSACGFKETGEMDEDGEIIMEMRI